MWTRRNYNNSLIRFVLTHRWVWTCCKANVNVPVAGENGNTFLRGIIGFYMIQDAERCRQFRRVSRLFSFLLFFVGHWYSDDHEDQTNDMKKSKYRIGE